MLRCVVLSILLVAPAAASASFKLGGRTQARYTFEEAPGEFSLPRVRLCCRADYLKATIKWTSVKGRLTSKMLTLTLSSVRWSFVSVSSRSRSRGSS